MCFYTDYDWYAEESTNSTSEAGTPCRCQECGKPLTIWDWRKVIDMKEHAACQICEEAWSDDYIDRAEMQQMLSSATTPEDAQYAQEHLNMLDTHECDYGETFHYVRCRDCDRILGSILAIEGAQGCAPENSQPALTELYENLYQHEDAMRYIDAALVLFPELVSVAKLQEVIAWHQNKEGR